MMRRSLYSKDTKHAPPLVEILWDKSGLMIEAKAGKLEIAEVGIMFKQALVEVHQAINKGKENAAKK